MLTIKAIIVGAPDILRQQLEQVRGKMRLVRHLAAFRPGPLTSTTASAKASLRAIARRWLALDEEIRSHDAHLEALVADRAPTLVQAHGMGVGTAAEMLLIVGDNPERVRSEAAFAKLCGSCPIPASSGKMTQHRLNRGGNRQANAALYRVVVTRLRRIGGFPCGVPPTESRPIRSRNAQMLLCASSLGREHVRLLRPTAEVPVYLAGDEAFETTNNLRLRLAFGGTPADIVESRLVRAQSTSASHSQSTGRA
jgi:hypothetical protein